MRSPVLHTAQVLARALREARAEADRRPVRPDNHDHQVSEHVPPGNRSR